MNPEQWLAENAIECIRYNARISPQMCRDYARHNPESCVGCARLKHPVEAPATCRLDDCDREHYADGLCRMHHGRRKITRQGKRPVAKKVKKSCQVEGCEAKHYGKMYCKVHYMEHVQKPRMKEQLRSERSARGHKACQVEGCEARHYAKGYCKHHYFKLRQTPRLAAKRREDRAKQNTTKPETLTLVFDGEATPLHGRLCRVAERHGTTPADEAMIYIEACLNYYGEQ